MLRVGQGVNERLQRDRSVQGSCRWRAPLTVAPCRVLAGCCFTHRRL